jgi:hypothetical protein
MLEPRDVTDWISLGGGVWWSDWRFQGAVEKTLECLFYTKQKGVAIYQAHSITDKHAPITSFYAQTHEKKWNPEEIDAVFRAKNGHFRAAIQKMSETING